MPYAGKRRSLYQALCPDMTKISLCNMRVLGPDGSRQPQLRSFSTDWIVFETPSMSPTNHCAEWEHAPQGSGCRACSAGFLPGTHVATTDRATKKEDSHDDSADGQRRHR